MPKVTPPVPQGPEPGATPPESSPDVPLAASDDEPTDELTAAPFEPEGAASSSSSRRGSASGALRRVTAATVMVALVAVLIGAGLGYVLGRATAPTPAYDQAANMMPGHMAPGDGPWFRSPRGQDDGRGRMGPGWGGQGGAGPRGWSDGSTN